MRAVGRSGRQHTGNPPSGRVMRSERGLSDGVRVSAAGRLLHPDGRRRMLREL